MDNTLSPVEVSQINYGNDLDYDKYKAKMISVINSHLNFKAYESKVISIIDSIPTPSKLEHIESKYDQCSIEKWDHELAVLFYKYDGTITHACKLVTVDSKLKIDIQTSIVEKFNFYQNFLPDNTPKMTNINNQHNFVMNKFGLIIQDILNSYSDGR